jgi:hypothetical protein
MPKAQPPSFLVDNAQLQRFTTLALRHATGNDCRSARNAMRLWNWADHQDVPEPFFAVLKWIVPPGLVRRYRLVARLSGQR